MPTERNLPCESYDVIIDGGMKEICKKGLPLECADCLQYVPDKTLLIK